MLSRLLIYSERIGANISGIIVMAMMVLTTADVFLRYVFNNPLDWNFELQSLLLVGVAYLGISYVQSQRRHVCMDVLPARLPKTNQLQLQLFGDIIFLFLMAIITWQMGIQAWNAWVTGDFVWGAVDFPLWPVKWAITLGTGLFSLRLIADILSNFRNIRWPEPSEGRQPGRYIGLVVIAGGLIILLAGIVIAGNMATEPQGVGWIVIALFFILLLSGTPVAAAMAVAGICGFWLLRGGETAVSMGGTVPYASVATYTMTVLPLFIIMGTFASYAGFAQDGFELARRWLRGIPGGLVQATVVGAAAFAAASGASIAACAVFSKMAIPEMLKHGVRKSLALGAVASAATLAIMIPPSSMFVIYGMLTGQSVGKLLIAGIIPGLIGAAMFMIMIFIRCKIDPSLVPPSAGASWKERFSALPRAWGILFIAIVVLGGIYTGVFTPTEAGAIGATVAFLGMIVTRKAKMRDLHEALLDTAAIASTVLIILVGGMMFGYTLAVSRLPAAVTEFVATLNVAPMVILIAIMVLYLILGCFVDSLASMIITLPIVYPVILELGFDPVWFGVLMVQTVEIALVTPPFGLNLFVMRGVIPGTALGEIFRGVGWFIVPLIVTLAIYIAFPQVALWLPSMMA
jgi:C4-dicarboxylate transporter DctM subunit